MKKYIVQTIIIVLISACSNSNEKEQQIENTIKPQIEEVEETLNVFQTLEGQWKTEGNEALSPLWLEFDSSKNEFYNWGDEENRPTSSTGEYKLIGDSIIQLIYHEYQWVEKYAINSIDNNELDIISLGVSAGNLVYKKTKYVEKNNDSTPIIATLTSVEESDFWGRVWLHTQVDGKYKSFAYWGEPDTEYTGDFEYVRKLVGKKISIKFRIEETLEEVDLHVDDETIHGEYGRIKEGNSDEKIEGTLLVHEHDKSGDLPSSYRIIENNGDTTTITSFVYDKHVALNGKKATVYYYPRKEYIAKSVVSLVEDKPTSTIFIGEWKKEDSSNPIDPTFFEIKKEDEYKIQFSNDDYFVSVENSSNMLKGYSNSGNFEIKLISENPPIVSYSDDGRGHFEPVKNVRFVKEKSNNKTVDHYICYKNDNDTSQLIWVSFTKKEEAIQIKYEDQKDAIDLEFDKEEFLCDGCAHPTIHKYYNDKDNGRYKLTHSGIWDYIEYTRSKDGKVFNFTIDHLKKQYSKTPCF